MSAGRQCARVRVGATTQGTVLARNRCAILPGERPRDGAADMEQLVREGEMPPGAYLLTHPTARLSAAEREQLAMGLDRTLGAGVETDDD